ncbi:hypothetical protein KOW79_022472 [Hemibagrus wyckioides]|uniref:Uncharacterized protein n=1 Tax=Hemibagrus wyckioides TaxID=337641 RepID=A0A9D3N013_9TELE|nr:hypothetical protein KOW79_022472 [Hemibagrus wyckioides]
MSQQSSVSEEHSSRLMASPFTELEYYIILFSLLVFSLFTLHGMIHERCTASNTTAKEILQEHQDPLILGFFILKSVMEIPFSGFELLFIVLALTVFCVFGLAAIYTRSQHSDNQGENGFTELNRTCHKHWRKQEFQPSGTYTLLYTEKKRKDKLMNL